MSLLLKTTLIVVGWSLLLYGLAYGFHEWVSSWDPSMVTILPKGGFEP